MRFLALLLCLLSSAAGAQSISGAPANPFALVDISQIAFGCNGTWGCNGPYTDTNAKTLRTQTVNTGVANLILIIAGQSNREAESPTSFVPTNASVVDNLNVSDGAIYGYSDPPLGSSYQGTNLSGGGAGTLGGRIADKFITAGTFARVIVAPVAIGGTNVALWATGGPLANRICVVMKRFAAKGIVPGTNVTFAIEWGQGENDNVLGTSASVYTSLLNQVIANAAACGFVGRWFVATESMNSGVTAAAVTTGQANTINGTTVFASGNIDSLTVASGSRLADQTHLNDLGSSSAATLIFNAMHASGAPF